MKNGSSPEARYLLIKAKAGLGNRMLAAVTGLVYADLTGRMPIIDWRDGSYAAPGVNSYPLLFRAPPGPEPSQVEGIEDVVPEIWRNRLHTHPNALINLHDPAHHSNPFIYRKYCVNIARSNHAEALAVYWSYLPKMRRLRPLMRNDPRFAGRSEGDIFHEYLDRYFTPKNRVLDAVGALMTPERRPVIGVHVRHTDRTVPLPAVHRALERCLKALPDAGIFLATDSDVAQIEFQARYPNVLTIEKWFAPGGQALHQNLATPDMIHEAENALIDMWALASCDHLIYARRSTFSHASRLIGQFPANAVTDIDAARPTVILKQVFQEYA
jgi:hypothetical protein